MINLLKIVSYHHFTKNLTRPHYKIWDYVNKGKEVWEIAFNTTTDPIMHAKHNLYNMNIAVMFIGDQTKLGITAARYYALINNKIFERINHRDIGGSARSGLKVKRDGKLIYYMRPLKLSKEDCDKIVSIIDVRIANDLV